MAALDLDVGALDWVRAHPAGYRSCRYSAVRPTWRSPSRPRMPRRRPGPLQVGSTTRPFSVTPRSMSPGWGCPRTHRIEPGAGRGRFGDRSAPTARCRVDWRHRERLFPSDSARGAGCAVARHSEGGDRGADPRAGRRLRAAGYPGECGRTRFRRHRRSGGGGGCGRGVSLSDDAAFINGAVLPVDSGRAAWVPDPEER